VGARPAGAAEAHVTDALRQRAARKIEAAACAAGAPRGAGLRIEQGLDAHCDSRAAYLRSVRDVSFALRTPAAEPGSLAERLRARAVHPAAVATMPLAELTHAAQREETERIVYNGSISPHVAVRAAASVGLYTCGKCRSQRTVFSTAQTRSGDEPMTVFIECVDCGKTWKQ
jgi:DNA-directed RNA polymerase subunit M/transcription elongation factor TFIIS